MLKPVLDYKQRFLTALGPCKYILASLDRVSSKGPLEPIQADPAQNSKLIPTTVESRLSYERRRNSQSDNRIPAIVPIPGEPAQTSKHLLTTNRIPAIVLIPGEPAQTSKHLQTTIQRRLSSERRRNYRSDNRIPTLKPEPNM